MTTRSFATSSGRSSDRHRPLTIVLHWLSAAAVLGAFAVAWSRAASDETSTRAALMVVHQTAGLLVLALLLLRVGARIATLSTAPRHDLPWAMHAASMGGHLLLYGLLLAMPLIGWSLANAHGHGVRLPGMFTLPDLVGADPDLAETLESWHVGLSWVLAAAVAAHAAAAAFHHVVRRDGVLRSMLPAWGSRPMAESGAAGQRYAEQSKGWS